jgi:putative transposase
VPVRYDPFDIGTAYAYVKNQWVKCQAQYYTTFQNCSERELKIATEELRKQRQNHTGQAAISAKKLAAFLSDAEGQESIQQQRMKDLATSGALKLIDNPSSRQSLISSTPTIEPEIGISPIQSAEPHQEIAVLPSNPSTAELEIYDEF